jgi:hypothetical protein
MGETTTVQERFLIFVDILGFYDRAEIISELAHQKDSSKIREQMVNIINDTLQLYQETPL